MKRSIFILVLLGVLAMSSLAPVMAQDEGLVIWADVERVDAMMTIANAFQEEFGVSVTVEEMGQANGRDALLEFGPAGEAADIAIVASDHIGQLVVNGTIIPIDLAGLEDNFKEGSLGYFTFNDALWGIPYATETTALIRNTDLVPEAPATWEEIASLCGELRDGGLAEYSILIQQGDTYHFSPVFTSFGGYIFGHNDDGSFNTADIGFAITAGERRFGTHRAASCAGDRDAGHRPGGKDQQVLGGQRIDVLGQFFEQVIGDKAVAAEVTPVKAFG